MLEVDSNTNSNKFIKYTFIAISANEGWLKSHANEKNILRTLYIDLNIFFLLS